MRTAFAHFGTDSSGAIAVEYILIIALLAIPIVALILSIGDSLTAGLAAYATGFDDS